MYRNNKKGVVSIATYSLIILLMFSIFSFSYWFYNSSKVSFEVELKKLETLDCVNSFRSEMINLVINNFSSVSYLNLLSSEEIVIFANSKYIVGTQTYGEEIIEVNVSTLGFEFCNNYSFSPRISSRFSYVGGCVLKNS